jgi:hypothetical protein
VEWWSVLWDRYHVFEWSVKSLSNYSFRNPYSRLTPRCSLNISHLISTSHNDPSLATLLFYVSHVHLAFNRSGPWRFMGSARGCSKTSFCFKYELADQQYLEFCHKKGYLHW